jgi:two-component sensor histidine kinase
MKNVLVVYYSQSGQLEEVSRRIALPFEQAADVHVQYLKIKPKVEFPFPWPKETFFDVFPESFRQVPVDIETPDPEILNTQFDLILLFYQVWYLSPSIPVTSFLKSEYAKKLLHKTDVVTISGSRNMWIMAQEKVKVLLKSHSANLVGNIALVDRHINLVSVITIVDWMFTGLRRKVYRFLPLPGISAQEIKESIKFGKIIVSHLRDSELGSLQSQLVANNAVEIRHFLVSMERDVKRLEIVADRFSKIGSTPSLSNYNVYLVIQDFVNYFKIRTSDKITFILTGDKHIEANLNAPLFDWILENLLKNAVNAIESEGTITVNISENIAKEEFFIDISDTGKGIPKSNFETVFQPGFTTRKRGWGLGLSLTKRMVDYHQGHIFVKESEIGKGTTFRIVLKSNLRYEPTQI